MYLLILFHCNLVYVFLSFDWINTIIITIVSVHVFAFRVHEHKSRINKDGAFWCNAFFMWFMVSLMQKTWKEKWKQDLGWYKSTPNLRNGHCLSWGDASFKEKGDVGDRCNIMTSLNFSTKESIIFLFQIAHYNLSICNKHNNFIQKPKVYWEKIPSENKESS